METFESLSPVFNSDNPLTYNALLLTGSSFASGRQLLLGPVVTVIVIVATAAVWCAAGWLAGWLAGVIDASCMVCAVTSVSSANANTYVPNGNNCAIFRPNGSSVGAEAAVLGGGAWVLVRGAELGGAEPERE